MQHFDKDTSVPISVPLIELFVNRDTLQSSETLCIHLRIMVLYKTCRFVNLTYPLGNEI